MEIVFYSFLVTVYLEGYSNWGRWVKPFWDLMGPNYCWDNIWDWPHLFPMLGGAMGLEGPFLLLVG